MKIEKILFEMKCPQQISGFTSVITGEYNNDFVDNFTKF